MEDRKLNRELIPTTPNIVPQRFTPVAEQFRAPVTQELRSAQGRWARGYSLAQIEYLQNQLRMSPNKRDAQWRAMLYDERGIEVGLNFAAQPRVDAKLQQAIQDAKTAQTVMMDKISGWAGNMDEEEMMRALPQIWRSFLPNQEQDIPADEADEALEIEEVEPVQVPLPPQVDFSQMPKSEVQAPEQLALGDILGQIARDNAKDN